MENENQSPVMLESDGEIEEISKVSRKVYAREFLFSFAMLDTCKRLPSGIYALILSGINDAWTTTTTHGDSYHATTWADSESGRFQGKKTQVLSQFSGLGILGNGASPNLSICGTPPMLSICGTPPTLSECGSKGLFSKSFKPYRPPHFYKANLHSEKLCIYSYNHELFHSYESPTQEKQREEQNSKAATELRKELLAVPEKRKTSPDGHKENMDPEDSENRKTLLNDCKELVESVVSSAPNVNDVNQQCDVVEDLAKGLLPYPSDAIHQVDEEAKLEQKLSLEMNPVTGISHGNKNGDSAQSSVALPCKRVELSHVSGQSSVALPCKRVELPHVLLRSTPSSATRNCSSQFDSINKLGVLNPDEINLFKSGKDTVLDISNSPKIPKNLPDRQMIRSGISKDLKGVELSVSHKDLKNKVTSKCAKFSFSVDNNSTRLTEDRIMGMCQEGILFHSDVKQTRPNKTKGKPSLYEDIKALIGLDLDSDDETELSPSNGFNEKANWIDELHLPDEESLMAAMLGKTHLSTPIEFDKTPNKFGNINASLTDKIYTQLVLGVNVKGSENCYNNPLGEYQPFHHSRLRPVGPFSQPPQAQEARKINHCTPRPTPIGRYHVDPMLQRQHLQIPIKGQPHRPNQMSPLGLNQYSNTEMIRYAETWNQNFCQSFQQMSYPGHQTPNSNHSATRNLHQATYIPPYFKNGAGAGAGAEQKNLLAAPRPNHGSEKIC